MAKPEEIYQCQTVNCGCIYDPDRGTAEVKSPRESGLRKPRMNGVDQFVAPAKNVSGHWQVPDL